MHDFGKLVYLDVQKTGSTFISQFLKECCTLPEVKFKKHGRISDDYEQESIYFISVRNPIEQYLSLFRYGLDKRGGAFTRLRKQGQADLYRPEQGAFEDFILFALNEADASVLDKGYELTSQKFGMGLMTHRHLMLSFHHPMRTLKNTGANNILAAYDKKKIWSFCVRQERLTEDLRSLSEAHPEFFDMDKVAGFLESGKKENRSKAGGALSTQVSDNVLDQLKQKEALIYDRFYPEI